MTAGHPRRSDPAMEEHWRRYLEQGDSFIRVGRRVFGKLPAEPRCRLCTAPFSGPGGSLMRAIGKRPSTANPHVCTSCENGLKKHRGGAEVSATLLFADIRGSTALAERMSPGEYRELLSRFYAVASAAVFDHDGVVDKFVGDELVAMFFNAFAGERHVARAIEAATALLRATGHAEAAGPWVPVGAGVHTGRAWFGAVGEGEYVELTAVGDTVNVAARLAAAADTSEILVSADAAAAAGLDPALERRSLDLKGRHEATEVVSLRIGGA